jgi:hypothetical protein
MWLKCWTICLAIERQNLNFSTTKKIFKKGLRDHVEEMYQIRQN